MHVYNIYILDQVLNLGSVQDHVLSYSLIKRIFLLGNVSNIVNIS